MAAAPPSPRPPRAHRDGGDAPISLFIETDLGTRLAMLVAPDTTIRGLKCTASAASSPPLSSYRGRVSELILVLLVSAQRR